jgi:hypothetical protein
MTIGTRSVLYGAHCAVLHNEKSDLFSNQMSLLDL